MDEPSGISDENLLFAPEREYDATDPSRANGAVANQGSARPLKRDDESRFEARTARKTGRFAEDFTQHTTEGIDSAVASRIEVLKKIADADADTSATLTSEELSLFQDSALFSKGIATAMAPAPTSEAPAVADNIVEDVPLPTAAVAMNNVYLNGWNTNFFDFRGNTLPRGSTLVGAAAFERQTDNSTALSLEPGAYLHLDLSTGSMLPAKSSKCTVIVLEVLYPQLPRDAASLLVYNPAFHQAQDRNPDGDVLVSSDGGVGALGRFGLGALALLTGTGPPPAVVPGEWCRIIIARHTTFMEEPLLTTFVNGKVAAQITDVNLGTERFSIARNTIDLFRSSRAGLQLPVKIRVAAVFNAVDRRSPQDLVKVLNKTNFTFSKLKLRQEVVDTRLFANLALASLFKRPPPIWMHPLFLFSLSAPLLSYKSSVPAASMSDFLPAFNLVLRGMLASAATTTVLDGLDDSHRECLAAVMHTFTRALPLMKRFPCGQRAGVAAMINYIKLVVEAVNATRVGETTLVPLALTKTVNAYNTQNYVQLSYFVLFERTTEDLCSIVLVNAALETGLSFHPTSAATPGELQYQLSLPVDNVPLSRALDGAFWTALTTMIDPIAGNPVTPQHDLYGRLLPTLTETPLAEIIDAARANADGVQEFSPFPLLAGSPSTLCLEALRFMLRRRGLSRDHARLVGFAFQARLLELAHSDVVCFPRLSDMDARGILAAIGTVAAEAARVAQETKLLGAATLANVCSSLHDLRAGINHIRTSYDSSSPPMVHLDDGGVSKEGTQNSLFPFVERFVRLEGVDGLAGAADKADDSTPYDVMRLPVRAKTFEDIAHAVLYTQEQTFHAADTNHVRNKDALIITLIEHLVTRILPVPIAIHASEEERANCPWQAEIDYRTQSRIGFALGRLALSFAASVIVVKNSPALDYTRLVVIGALGVMLDSVLRRRTRGYQCPVSLALLEGRFGPSGGVFAEQTATSVGTYPELQVVRAQVLEYFSDISPLHVIFPFRGTFFAAADLDFMKDINTRLSLKTDRATLVNGLLPSNSYESPVMETYPELHQYRDVWFYFQYLQYNTDKEQTYYDNNRPLPAPVTFNSYDKRQLNIYFMNKSVSFSQAPSLRFQPGASLSGLTGVSSIQTEDDVLHVPSLPNFAGALGQADAELLLSYLTVPYLRIPLVLGFFATEERINALKSSKLCTLLEAVLFEPGKFLTPPARKGINVQRTLPNGSLSRPKAVAIADGEEVKTAADQEAAALNEPMVPVNDSTILGARFGYLLNEIRHAPGNVLASVGTMVELALALDIGTVQSSSVPILLFVFRTAARVENYASFVQRQMDIFAAKASGKPIDPTWATVDCPDVIPATDEHRHALSDGLSRLRRLLWGKVQTTLVKWGAELYEIIRASSEGGGDGDTDTADDDEQENKQDDPNDEGQPIYYHRRTAGTVEVDVDTENFNGSTVRSRYMMSIAERDANRQTGTDKKSRELAEDQKALKKLSVDAATRLLCALHAHSVVLFRNVDSALLDSNPAHGATLITAMLFLTTRHSFGKDTLRITEHVIFEAMHTVRRTLVAWIRRLNEKAIGLVMEAVIRVVTCEGVLDMRHIAALEPAADAASGSKTPVVEGPTGGALVAPSGSLLAVPSLLRRTSSLGRNRSASYSGVNASDAAIDTMMILLAGRPADAGARRVWRYVPGPACTGRFVSVDLAPENAEKSLTLKEKEKEAETDEQVSEGATRNALWSQVKLGMTVDTQSWQLTLSGSQLQALPVEVLGEEDVAAVCGTRSMQAALTETTKNRKVYRLVGRNYDLHCWTKDMRGEYFEAERLYDAHDLHAHEQWVAELFEPVRLAFYETPPPPLVIFMPTQSLAKNASVAYLVGMHPSHHGAWREFVVYKHRRMVEIYTVVSHGRRFYRRLDYSSNTNFSLLSLQPGIDNRQRPWATWERHAGGDPHAHDQFDQASVVIHRGPECVENLAGTIEMYVPPRFLVGLLPEGLVEKYSFWQDENDNIRGYPSEGSKLTTVVFVELMRLTRSDGFEEPTVSARVTRMPRKLMEQRARGVSSPVASAPTGADTGALEDEELELVNLLHAPKYSQAFQLGTVLARLDNLSHVLAWKRVEKEPPLAGAHLQPLHMEASDAVAAANAAVQPAKLKLAKTTAEEAAEAEQLKSRKHETLDLPLIELPRLKMSFHTRIVDSGECRLYSLDHADLYVSNARTDDLECITAGIPHSLIMSNDNGELSMLVPCVNVARPEIATAPLSTELVLMRNDTSWLEKLETRYFLYPIHVSLSFVFTPTLASALYLMLLRLLHRDYAEVFRLADTIGSDTELSAEEMQIFSALGEANSDIHADACACRLKITLAVMDSVDASLPWALLPVYGIYAQRISTLSATCRLPHSDEVRVGRAALTPIVCGRIRRSHRAVRSLMTPPWLAMATMAYNRLQYIEALVYDRPAYRTLTMPVPVVNSIYTADIGTIEELLAESGDSVVSAEIKDAVRSKVSRSFQRRVSQVHRGSRNVAGVELFTITARYLAHSETCENKQAGALGFLYVYQLLQCDVRVRVSGRDCARGMGIFAASMLPVKTYGKLLTILKLMMQRQDIANILPRWSVFNKAQANNDLGGDMGGSRAKPTPVEGLEDFVKQVVGTLARLYKVNPQLLAARYGSKINTAAAEAARSVFTSPAPLGLVKAAEARAWVIPQLSDYDCSSRYLVASPSAPADDETAGQTATLERRVRLQGLGGKAGDTSVAATLKRAIRDWDLSEKNGQRHLSDKSWMNFASEASRGLQPLVSTILADLNVTEEVVKRALVASGDSVAQDLPVNVRAHPGVQSGVALAMQNRLEKDMELFSTVHNASSDTYIKGLSDADVRALVGGPASSGAAAAGTGAGAETVASIKSNIESLVRRMTAVKTDDERAVQLAFRIVIRMSRLNLNIRKSGNSFAERLFGRDKFLTETVAGLSQDESVALQRHMHHWLLVLAGCEPELKLEYTIGALLSSRAVFDLRKINPFLTDDMITVMFSFVESALLRANRIGHINRTLGEARGLLKLLDKVAASALASSGGANQGDAALIAGAIQKSKALGSQLTAARYYFSTTSSEAAAATEGAEAVAEITSASKLSGLAFAAHIPEAHLKGAITPDVFGNEAAALAHETKLNAWVAENGTSALNKEMALCCILEARNIRKLFGHGLRGESIPIHRGPLVRLAESGLYGISRAAQAGVTLPTGTHSRDTVVQYDPRFLVFEFTWNIMLRKSQVAMVRDFADNIRAGKSIVKQMIMGAGKTTVVAPLLTLMFGDGKSLVMEVVPPALLEFSRSIMRSTFSTVMYKRVFTFHFDRATIPHPSMLTKLRSAVAARGVVISTPTSVKSVMLKLLETQQHLMDLTLPRTRELEHERDVLVAMLREFQDGVLLMDEVDMILHPLKSELNFPIGAKHELDFDPLRWKLAMHVLDAVYYRATPVVPADFRDSKVAASLLEQISAAIGTGLLERHMQSSPHIVLLNADFYYSTVLPLMCDWVMLWIEAQHLTGITSAQMREYLMTPGIHAPELAEAVERGVTPHFRKMLNLARDWLRSYLPHVMQKIDRVSFGLLSEDDYARAIKNDPNIPETRAKLAIPFLGKDVPSETSEFAHPDVIIGLTYMAYRYEGLRYADFCEIIDSMHSSLSKELGPYLKRPSVLRYARWVHEAAGQIRGESPPLVAPSAATTADDEEGVEVIDTRPEVMPLRLLKRSNVDHMQALFDLVIREPLVIQWYLNDFVFPAHLRHQKIKLSASGVEVGGDMLFSRRVGFSGTPSDLLPLELGKCDYEKGTDGMMVHVLTSSQMVGASYVEEDWSVRSLLKRVATQTNASGEPMFQALIDTGALITGFSNKGVAEYLLEHGLAWADGVVFLDELDRKMVLVRATKRVVKLAQCGIPAEKRFAFYDQVHTTGMDISHRLDACAAITLGKDMTFRDYAQGAYRMRGLSKGQTIHLLVTPEIDRLIQRQIAKAVGGDRPVIKAVAGAPEALLQSVVAWLVINAMQSEQTQFNQLAIQNVTNVWRKNAFKDLVANAKYFGLDAFPVDPVVAAEYKAKKARIARQAALAKEENGEKAEVNLEQRKNERRAARRRLHKQRLIIRAEFMDKVRAAGGTTDAYHAALPEFRKQVEDVLLARRKELFSAAMQGYSTDFSKPITVDVAPGAKAAEPTVPRNPDTEAALEVFEEDVNFTLDESVPQIVPFNESLQKRIDHNKRFILSSGESDICTETVHSVMRSAGDTLQMLALTAEMVQTVEEERERAVEQEQESEIEVEKFVDQSYSRDNESQVPWPLSRLCHAPGAAVGLDVHPFYSASLFTVPGAAGLAMPPNLFVSNNYFDKRWTGARRVKNATMYLEYAPKNDAGAGVLATWLCSQGPASLAARLESGSTGVELAAQLATAFQLFDKDGSGDLDEEEAANLISAISTERFDQSRKQAAQLFRALNVTALTRAHVEKILSDGTLHAGEAGRYFVCLSLREAESLRWWMHKRAGKGLFDDTAVDALLRCSANDNTIIDASIAPPALLTIDALTPVAKTAANAVMAATSTLANAQASMIHSVWQAVRYLNCETYFSTADINALLSVIDQHDAAARLRTFSAVQACRRRARRKWHETPVARLFNVGYNSRLHALKARAISYRIRHVLRERHFSSMDAFRAFDYNRNGLLSPDEVLGGVSWLGLDAIVSLNDVIDLIGFSERKDGNLQTKDFGDLLRDPSLADDRIGSAKLQTSAPAVEEDDFGGIDDADLPTVMPARAEEILRAWSERSIADLVGSTANAAAAGKEEEKKDGEEEKKDATTEKSDEAEDRFQSGVTIGRDDDSRETWLELDLTEGIPSCVQPVGNVTYVPADAPGNLDRIGYVKCSNLGGFIVTIPAIGPFKKYPSARTMKSYQVMMQLRFPSVPSVKFENTMPKKVDQKRRPLFAPDAKEGCVEIALLNNIALPLISSVRNYESYESVPINTWEGFCLRYTNTQFECCMGERILRTWGQYKNEVHHSFKVGLPVNEAGKQMGPKDEGHEFHIRSLIIRSVGRNQVAINTLTATYMKSLKWACGKCGAHNSNTSACGVCGADKTIAVASLTSAHAVRTRVCGLCFHTNPAENSKCDRCHTELATEGEVDGDADANAGANADGKAGAEDGGDVDEVDVAEIDAIEGDEGDAEGDEGDAGEGDAAAPKEVESSQKTNAQLKAARHWRGSAVSALLGRMNVERKLMVVEERNRYYQFEEDDEEA